MNCMIELVKNHIPKFKELIKSSVEIPDFEDIRSYLDLGESVYVEKFYPRDFDWNEYRKWLKENFCQEMNTEEFIEFYKELIEDPTLHPQFIFTEIAEELNEEIYNQLVFLFGEDKISENLFLFEVKPWSS